MTGVSFAVVWHEFFNYLQWGGSFVILMVRRLEKGASQLQLLGFSYLLYGMDRARYARRPRSLHFKQHRTSHLFFATLHRFLRWLMRRLHMFEERGGQQRFLRFLTFVGLVLVGGLEQRLCGTALN